MRHGKQHAEVLPISTQARAEAIREYKAAYPGATATEIAAALTVKLGATVTNPQVYAALQKKATPASNGHAKATNGKLPAMTEPLADMIEAQKFANSVGSIERAAIALNRIRQINDPSKTQEALQA